MAVCVCGRLRACSAYVLISHERRSSPTRLGKRVDDVLFLSSFLRRNLAVPCCRCRCAIPFVFEAKSFAFTWRKSWTDRESNLLGK